MTFSKFLPILCAVTVGAIGLTARAANQDPDNPAQAAARIALAKQLFELQATNASAAPTNEVTPAANSKEARKAAKAKAKAEKAAAEAKAKQDAAAAQAAAEQARAQAQAKAQAQQAAAKTQADQNAAQQRAALNAALAASSNTPPPAQGQMAAPAGTNSWAAPQPAAKAKKEKKHQKPETPPAASVAVASPSAASPTNNYVGQDLGMKPITTPALPISASKEQRLQALLQKYEADQITPEEYHQQRAAILAEP